MNDLYMNIKKRRLELNMSQQELAEAVGYKGKSMISQVEKGLVALPEPMIAKFADALYTTPATLLGFENVKIDPVSGYPISDGADESGSYDPAVIKKAIQLYEQFSSLTPEYQETLLRMLEAAQIAADLRQTKRDKK